MEQRKRYGGHPRRVQIPNRISIEARPAIVASKLRLGDWEADTIIGARHRGAILSCTERKSKLTLLRRLASKGAWEVKRNLIELLSPCADQVHTITVDNGKEFSDHKDIAAVLQQQFNRGYKGYRPLQAQSLAGGRRYESQPARIAEQAWQRVELLLRQQWSSEQIAGRLKLEQQASISHEWIYIYADKQRGGTLYKHLRSQKKQRKRYGGYARRAQIPNRISIDQRPAIVARKDRLGDWEADTIIGARP